MRIPKKGKKRTRKLKMQERKLSSLPPTSDEYWQFSKIIETDKKEVLKCKHNFVHRGSREVECAVCHAGFYIDPPMVVREGHIYIDEGNRSQFVI